MSCNNKKKQSLDDHNETLPWPDLMALGLGELALSPEAFWAMTLPELRAALIGKYGIGPSMSISQNTFDHLLQTFPDQKHRTQQSSELKGRDEANG